MSSNEQLGATCTKFLSLQCRVCLIKIPQISTKKLFKQHKKNVGIKQSFVAAGVVDVSFAHIRMEADVCLRVYRLSPVPANLNANRSLEIPHSQGIQSYCQIIIGVQVFGFL